MANSIGQEPRPVLTVRRSTAWHILLLLLLIPLVIFFYLGWQVRDYHESDAVNYVNSELGLKYAALVKTTTEENGIDSNWFFKTETGVPFTVMETHWEEPGNPGSYQHSELSNNLGAACAVYSASQILDPMFTMDTHTLSRADNQVNSVTLTFQINGREQMRRAMEQIADIKAGMPEQALKQDGFFINFNYAKADKHGNESSVIGYYQADADAPTLETVDTALLRYGLVEDDSDLLIDYSDHEIADYWFHSDKSEFLKLPTDTLSRFGYPY